MQMKLKQGTQRRHMRPLGGLPFGRFVPSLVSFHLFACKKFGGLLFFHYFCSRKPRRHEKDEPSCTRFTQIYEYQGD